MKYPAHAYADAFLSLIEEHPEKKKEILGGFIQTLNASGDIQNADRIIACVEEKIARKEGRAKIKVYSARALSEALTKKIRDAFGKDALIQHIITPEIIAGVKIVINDEIMIDATLKKKLELITKPKHI